VLAPCRSWLVADISEDHTASIIKAEVKNVGNQLLSCQAFLTSSLMIEAVVLRNINQLLHGASAEKQVQYQITVKASNQLFNDLLPAAWSFYC
jgi:hypothetical protein